MFLPLLVSPRLRAKKRLAFVVAVALAGPLCSGAGAQNARDDEAQVAQSPGEEGPLLAPFPLDNATDNGEEAPGDAANQNGATTPGFEVSPPINGYGNAPRSTPEMRRALLEVRMRDLMKKLGILSLPTQDAILAFMSADEDGKRQVREAGRKLLQGVRRDAPPERLKALLGDYQSAIQTDQARRERAQTALDAQVGWSLDARLESLLWMLGVLGQGQSAFGSGALGAGEAPTARGAAGQYQTPRAGAFYPATAEIAGTLMAKSGPTETGAWLEIRDANGRLWRLKPDPAPVAHQVLSRQIEALSLGDHLVVRVAAPVPAPVLLAIIPGGADPTP